MRPRLALTALVIASVAGAGCANTHYCVDSAAKLRRSNAAEFWKTFFWLDNPFHHTIYDRCNGHCCVRVRGGHQEAGCLCSAQCPCRAGEVYRRASR